MADRDFKSIFVLIAVCICTRLDVVMLGNPPGSNWAGYYKETANSDFAVRMWYSQHDGDTALKVTISYDTETDSANAFFTKQITNELVNQFDSCKTVKLVLNPCTTSVLNQGSLLCLKGQTQCYLDQVHSCIAKATDGSAMAKFLICRYSGISTEECGKKIGLKSDNIAACVNDGTGANNCNAYHTAFIDAKTKRKLSDEEIGKYPDAINNFKEVVCQVLAQGALACHDACGTS